MKFEEALPHLYCDGSLRDVYVLQASAGELDRFLDYVRLVTGPDSYKVGGESKVLPESYAVAFAGGSEIGVCSKTPRSAADDLA